MFQRIIFDFIQSVKKLYEKLDRAYQETYADLNVSFQAKEEINKRRKINKKLFINKAMEQAKKDFRKENGFEPHNVELRRFAEEMFRIALQRGDLDEFYNMRSELNGRNDL